MRTINTTDKFVKLDLNLKDKGNITVVFEQPVAMQWYYRVFRKPSGRYVALRDMSDAKSGWKFVASVNLAELYPGSKIV